MQVDELAGLPQPVEELAKVFLHGASSGEGPET
jgi:hypothetical protein